MTALFPFTQAQFLEIFRQYNTGIGVGQALILMVAVVGLSFAFWRNRVAGRVVSGSFAVLWLWMSIVYFGIFFSRISPAAPLLAILFAVQAVLFVVEGFRGDGLNIRFSPTLRGWIGSLVIIYAVMVYPAMTFVYHQNPYYPSSPTFGVPNPTVMFTLGLLLWSSASWRLLVIPFVWAIIGTWGAVLLNMPQDYGLAVTAALTLVLPRSRRREGAWSRLN